MANQLFSQLNQNQQSQNNDVYNMMKDVMSSSNPQQTLLTMASKNNQLANVLNEIQQNGGDAKSLFFRKVNSMGINPNNILSQLNLR